MSLLYEAESKEVEPSVVLAELPVVPDQFVVDLVCGVEANRPRIDDLIAGHAIGWTMDRMPVVDRALLRLGRPEYGKSHRQAYDLRVVAVEPLDAIKASMFAEHFQYRYTLTLRLQRLERDRRNNTLSASRMAARI